MSGGARRVLVQGSIAALGTLALVAALALAGPKARGHRGGFPAGGSVRGLPCPPGPSPGENSKTCAGENSGRGSRSTPALEDPALPPVPAALRRRRRG